MSVRNSIADGAMKTMNVTHRLILKVSGGRLLSKPFGMPTVELHTTGRRSGARRSTLLTAPVHDSSRVVLVASKGGDDRHPLWYLNLCAQPEVEVTIDGVTRPATARTASADEKAELWPAITEIYRGYASYQKRTERDIPVVICEFSDP
jgi:deazaflavin-dependent oxidoreductase (nitroreductase family)